MLFIERLEVKAITAQNLHLSLGECISLTGASGMGKSLFLKGLADLVFRRGKVLLDGVSQDEMDAPNWRQRVTYVGAKPAWWADHVRDHFQDTDWLASQLSAFDLPDKALDWTVQRLSSGEAQRLALLRALEGSKDQSGRYLLLDEPTSALDSLRQKQVESYLQKLLDTQKIAVLFVSHDEEQVKRFAQKNWQIYNRSVREVPIC
jgi:ABC-type iron transport system FetAB ATPase subunit